jgi:hypothetical protein
MSLRTRPHHWAASNFNCQLRISWRYIYRAPLFRERAGFSVQMTWPPTCQLDWTVRGVYSQYRGRRFSSALPRNWSGRAWRVFRRIVNAWFEQNISRRLTSCLSHGSKIKLKVADFRTNKSTPHYASLRGVDFQSRLSPSIISVNTNLYSKPL